MRPLFMVVLVLPLVLLAGCSSTSPGSEAATQEPCRVESADDYSCLERDAGRSPDEVAHQHDYWRGQERVTLIEETRQGGGLISACEHWGWYTFRPDAPATVYQGTATLEMEVVLTDSADSFYTAPQLWIKTAMDDAPRYVADLTGRDSLTFTTNNTANDLPHDRISSWEFHLYVAPGDPRDPFCHMRFAGSMELKVDIVKGLEIPFYPGHPDRWQNRTEIRVLEHARNVGYYRGGDAQGMCLAGTLGDDCLWDPHLADDGVVIPHDARRVEVTLRNDADLPLRLLYHGADTRELTDPGVTVGAGEEETLEIDVGDRGDGPYARQSLWEFWVWPAHDSEVYTGEYALRVLAYPT